MSIEDQATLAVPATERRQPRRRVPRLRIMATVALWSSLWWLIIGALVAPLVAGGWWTVLGAAAISVAPLLVILEQFAGGYPSALVRVLVFRPFLYVQLATPFVALAAAAGTLAGALVGRGVLVGRWALAAAAATFTVTALVGYIGSRQLRLKHLEARFPDLPPDLDGLRIVQVSDVHVGPHTPARHLRRIVAAVEQSRPDVIALTGDHVDDYAHDVTLFAQAFGTLRAPLGVFAVPGNHDIYAGWAHVRDGLETMGAVVLVNRAVERRRGWRRCGSRASAIRPPRRHPRTARPPARPISSARSPPFRPAPSRSCSRTTRRSGRRSRRAAHR
jgi:hypothetical protein